MGLGERRSFFYAKEYMDLLPADSGRNRDRRLCRESFSRYGAELRPVLWIVAADDIGSGHSEHYLWPVDQDHDRKYTGDRVGDHNISFDVTLHPPDFWREAVGKEVA